MVVNTCTYLIFPILTFTYLIYTYLYCGDKMAPKKSEIHWKYWLLFQHLRGWATLPWHLVSLTWWVSECHVSIMQYVLRLILGIIQVAQRVLIRNLAILPFNISTFLGYELSTFFLFMNNFGYGGKNSFSIQKERK